MVGLRKWECGLQQPRLSLQVWNVHPTLTFQLGLAAEWWFSKIPVAKAAVWANELSGGQADLWRRSFCPREPPRTKRLQLTRLHWPRLRNLVAPKLELEHPGRSLFPEEEKRWSVWPELLWQPLHSQRR